jgi:hypothetical protein
MEYRKADDKEFDVKNKFYEVGRKDLVEKLRGVQLRNMGKRFERLSTDIEFDFAPSDFELLPRELVPCLKYKE